MKIERIYKARMWVVRRITRGRLKGQIGDVEHHEEIIINNLDTAKRKYEQCKKAMELHKGMSGYSGGVELFEPHIFENGTIAYWPEDEKYIMQEKFR
jgi:hypothetical protein